MFCKCLWCSWLRGISATPIVFLLRTYYRGLLNGSFLSENCLLLLYLVCDHELSHQIHVAGTRPLPKTAAVPSKAHYVLLFRGLRWCANQGNSTLAREPDHPTTTPDNGCRYPQLADVRLKLGEYQIKSDAFAGNPATGWFSYLL